MPKFIMPPSVAREMEAVVAKGVATYIDEFVSQLFPAPLTDQAYDVVLAGIARAIKDYEERKGRRFAATLAYNLLDLNMENKQ
jgi:hypothetical protein